jgi:hypothetical protein
MKRDFDRNAEPARDVAAPPSVPANRPVLTLDVALYEQYLAEGGLSEEQKREFLEALWTIIVGFVDLGFGIHPLQLALEDGAAGSALQEEQQQLKAPGLCGDIARGLAAKEEE